jgi:hypothetical protein
MLDVATPEITGKSVAIGVALVAFVVFVFVGFGKAWTSPKK